MCLIIWAWRQHPDVSLILGANRDEFYARPTAAMAFWDDHPQVLAGRDLKAGGTWMGVTRTGRLAAITNYRDPAHVLSDAPSRGQLVSNFLIGDLPPEDYLKQLQHRASVYNGFNLITTDGGQLCYFGNRGPRVHTLKPGIYGLSNHLLDTPWPKVSRCKSALADLLATPLPEEKMEEKMFAILKDRHVAPDHQLPDTGVGLDWERRLAPAFITSPTYGTRCTTVVTVSAKGRVRVCEKTWPMPDRPADPVQTRRFSFRIKRQ